MSATKRALEFVDAKSKYTVFGFNREAAHLFKCIIPTPITDLCLLYYFEYDKWDKEYIGDMMEILGNDCLKYADQSGNGGYTAFLKKEFDSGIHSWRFRIKKVDINAENPGAWRTTIGIFPVTDQEDLKITAGGVFILHGGYGWGYQSGQVVNSAFDFTKYGKRCVENDIIQMIVDCDKGEISYTINEIEYGKAMDIKTDTLYRAAVNLCMPGDCIQLL